MTKKGRFDISEDDISENKLFLNLVRKFPHSSEILKITFKMLTKLFFLFPSYAQ